MCVGLPLINLADLTLILQNAETPGLCAKLRAAGVVKLWLKRLEDTPDNKRPNIRPTISHRSSSINTIAK